MNSKKKTEKDEHFFFCKSFTMRSRNSKPASHFAVENYFDL